MQYVNLVGTLTADEVTDIMLKGYKDADSRTRILYRCWKYQAEGFISGGRLAPSFEDYCQRVTLTECIAMIRGYLIDTSEFGGLEAAVAIISMIGVDRDAREGKENSSATCR